MGVAEALEETLTALADSGRLEAVDSGLVALCRSTASALERHPERATLIKEYRESLVLLLASGADRNDSELDKLLAALRDPEGSDPTEPLNGVSAGGPPVGHPPDGLAGTSP